MGRLPLYYSPTDGMLLGSSAVASARGVVLDPPPDTAEAEADDAVAAVAVDGRAELAPAERDAGRGAAGC